MKQWIIDSGQWFRNSANHQSDTSYQSDRSDQSDHPLLPNMKKLLLLIALSLCTMVHADNTSKTATITSDDPNQLPITDYDGVVANFKNTYKTLGKPRILVYVNRNLIKDRGEMMDIAKVETSVKTKGDPVPTAGNINVQIGADNKSTTSNTPAVTGKGGEAVADTSLSTRVIDPQNKGVSPISDFEARQIEEVFQHPFFDASARFVDQKVAELATRGFKDADPNFLTAPTTDKERQEIESLRKSADLVIEILAHKKTVTILQTSGNDQKEERLNLTATVIQLKDGLKIAQVSSDSLFKFNRRRGEARSNVLAKSLPQKSSSK